MSRNRELALGREAEARIRRKRCIEPASGKDPRHEGVGVHDSREGDGAHDQDQRVEHEAHEAKRGRVALFFLDLRERRDESLAQCAFSEHVTKKVRDPKRGIVGVEADARREQIRQHLLAHEPEHARHHDANADGAGGAGELATSGSLVARVALTSGWGTLRLGGEAMGSMILHFVVSFAPTRFRYASPFL